MCNTEIVRKNKIYCSNACKIRACKTRKPDKYKTPKPMRMLLQNALKRY